MDFVRELRLRQWARQNYVPLESRKPTWHPVVLDEMVRRDLEIVNEIVQATEAQIETSYDGIDPDVSQELGSVFVPLAPTPYWGSR